jgi:hypothetical protein
VADSGGLFPTRVEVRGLKELQRDFASLGKAQKREIQKQMRKLAEPAADLIRREAAGHGFSARTLSGIRPGSRSGAAVVRQSRGKVTGKRADFGSIQFRLAFLPGAEKAEPVVEKGVEDWLERISADHGLRMS